MTRDHDTILRSTLRARERSVVSTRIGIEHEFRLRSGNDVIDFRRLIHDLPIEGRRIDPGDPNAYRCAWGGTITADGTEAEIATPPVGFRRGFTGAVRGWSERGTAALIEALDPSIRLEGYSTHLSISVDETRSERIASLYARTFAPALMLLMDRPTSPGLLVRPRPGRLELGGEFVNGDQLRAVAAFAAGSAIACARASVETDRRTRALPPRIRVKLEPGRERFGWYVDRHAFGTDLYARGRAAELRRRSGRFVIAQSHLERCWELARDELPPGYDTEPADELVFGRDALPRDPGIDTFRVRDAAPRARTTFEIARPGYHVNAAIATWAFTIYELANHHARRYACIPAELNDRFVRALSDGELDHLLLAYLAAPPQGVQLENRDQTGEPGLYDEVPAPTQLLDPERSPEGRPGSPSTRPGKVVPPVGTGQGYIPGWWKWAAGGLVALLVGTFFVLRSEPSPVSEPAATETAAPKEDVETSQPPPEEEAFVLPGDTLELIFSKGKGNCGFPESFGATLDANQRGDKVALVQQGTDQKTTGTVTPDGKLTTEGETAGHTEIYQLQVEGDNASGRYSYFDSSCDHHYAVKGRFR